MQKQTRSTVSIDSEKDKVIKGQFPQEAGFLVPGSSSQLRSILRRSLHNVDLGLPEARCQTHPNLGSS